LLFPNNKILGEEARNF